MRLRSLVPPWLGRAAFVLAFVAMHLVNALPPGAFITWSSAVAVAPAPAGQVLRNGGG